MEQLTGNVFNIQRYTIHDRTGTPNRTIFKGLPTSM